MLGNGDKLIRLGFAIAFISIRATCWGQLIGVQNVDLQVGRDAHFHRSITQEERDTLRVLGINLLLNANEGFQDHNQLIDMSHLILDWADSSGGYPKLCLYPAQFVTGPATTYTYFETYLPNPWGKTDAYGRTTDYWWQESKPSTPTKDQVVYDTLNYNVGLGFDFNQGTLALGERPSTTSSKSRIR
jgi:hypothetical protein